MQGTKLMIEGPFAKSGKTLLATELTIFSLNQDPDIIGFGNMDINHEQFEKRKIVSPSFFDKDREYLCVLDEVDVRYSYQKHYWNEGLLAFWGFGASHNKCAIVATVQREYQELETKYLRQYHIILESLLFNRKGIPYAIAGYFTLPFVYRFFQFIYLAINRYDPYEANVYRTDFYDFAPEVSERNRIKGKEQNNEEKPKRKLMCDNCSHTWFPVVDHPVSCPKCKKRFGYSRLD